MLTTAAEKILAWLLKEEDCESDDRRFFCSYLISHTSLSMEDADDNQIFFDIMQQSLIESMQADKLSDHDRQGIETLWNEAFNVFNGTL